MERRAAALAAMLFAACAPTRAANPSPPVPPATATSGGGSGSSTGAAWAAAMCTPCTTDSECGSQGLGYCVLESGQAGYCGPTCQTAADCPAGASCFPANTGIDVCYPAAQTCVGWHAGTTTGGATTGGGGTSSTSTSSTSTTGGGITSSTSTTGGGITSSTSTSTTSTSGGTGTGPLTCSSPGNYNQSGGGCGTERWAVKTGTDADASSVNMTPVASTIAYLASLPAPSSLPSNNRIAPTELQTVILSNVQVQEVKTESDSDYHLVIADSSNNTMIAEVPFPGCVGSTSPFACLITHARGEVDLVGSGAAGQTATLIGVPFFDYPHGQTGVAPNAIELHPVLSICFGANCTVPTSYLRLRNSNADAYRWLLPPPFGDIPSAWIEGNFVDEELLERDDELGNAHAYDQAHRADPDGDEER